METSTKVALGVHLGFIGLPLTVLNLGAMSLSLHSLWGCLNQEVMGTGLLHWTLVTCLGLPLSALLVAAFGGIQAGILHPLFTNID